MTDYESRVRNALDVLNKGIPEGEHHLKWVIDQVLRTLTGCLTVTVEAADVRGNPYTYEVLGESEEYERWVAAYKNGKDGPDTFSWDVGTAP